MLLAEIPAVFAVFIVGQDPCCRCWLRSILLLMFLLLAETLAVVVDAVSQDLAVVVDVVGQDLAVDTVVVGQDPCCCCC